METCIVEYHSRAWDSLVEQGYITMFVEDGFARMIRQAPRFRLWR